MQVDDDLQKACVDNYGPDQLPLGPVQTRRRPAADPCKLKNGRHVCSAATAVGMT